MRREIHLCCRAYEALHAMSGKRLEERRRSNAVRRQLAAEVAAQQDTLDKLHADLAAKAADRASLAERLEEATAGF